MAAEGQSLPEAAIAEELNRASKLLERGDVDGAESIVKQVEKIAPQDRQLRFLNAHIAIRRGDPDRAISIFRGLLKEDPTLIRVRLDLAKTFFDKGDYEAARYHFELALGSDLPDPVKRNVNAYLDRINYSETQFTFSAFFVHDSNANQGPRTDVISISGQTFTLASNAKATSASGVVVLASGRYAFGGNRRNYLTGDLEHRQYQNSDLDYSFIQAGIGHSIPLESWRVGAETGMYDTLYQNRQLSWGPWAKIYASRQITPRFLLNGAFQVRWNDYPYYSYLSGRQDILSLDSTINITPTTFATAGAFIGDNSANESPYSYNNAGLRAGIVKELPFGFTINGAVSASRFWYGAPDPLFLQVRNDSQIQFQVNLVKRDWVYAGLAPRVFFLQTKNNSNIPLYSFTRQFAGLGLTKIF